MASRNRRRSRRDAPGDDGAPGRVAAWWRARPGWQQHALCLALLFVISLIFFAPVHFGDGALGGGDSVNWRAQAEAMIEYRQATGREALWNPNVFGGMPGYMISYAEQVPQLDAVPRFLRGFLWPTSHFLFLLFGTYGFVFFLTKNRGAAVLSAVAFGMTTYLTIILGAGHNTKFIALCFAPWMAWAFGWALRRPRWLAALAFAIALAANLRAGHVQITYYLTFLLGVWWIVEGIGALRHRQEEGGRLAHFGWATGMLALGSLLGLMMVAQPYLVFQEYKGYTIRGDAAEEAGDSGMGIDYAMRWSQGVGELTTLAVADAYGGSSRDGTYWGPKPFTEGPHYLGGIVLFLALLATWKVRRNAVRAFALGAFLMTLFALGHHFALFNEAMYAYFPLFDAFRAPETWMSMVAFALAVLAGIGADYASRRATGNASSRKGREKEEQQRTRAIYASAGGVAAFVAVLLLGANTFFDYGADKVRDELQQQIAQRPDLSASSPRVQQAVDQQVRQYMQQARPERESALTGDALRTLLFLALATAALWAYRRGTLSWPLAAGALVLLVGLDLGGVARRHLSSDTLAETGDPADQITQYGADRFIQEQQREAGGKGHFRVLSLADRGGPMSSGRASYFHESLGGYHGAKLRRYQDFIDHVYRRGTQQGLPNENALDLLSARYLIVPAQAAGRVPGTRVAYQGEGPQAPAVLENTDALPRAFFVGQTEVVERAEQMWDRLADPSFEPGQTALLSEPIEGFEPAPLDSASSSATRIELQEYTPREIVWQVETDAPRLFVASEVYYPAGWSATLDGEPVEIHRVDYLLRGVAVPAGEHRLVMRFDPPRHRAGLWLSGASTALVYGAALLLGGRAVWRRREQWGAEDEDDEASA